ncbi:prolipoprotein diacylglyceryl transferase [Leptospira mayottensis]|uniref:Phosphatidylglycerol--prolipoprotein diacylglyceryl transferase n=2 Tax=Leptospira mayottensis TaxID=1137606 RepID=A0AA87MKA0_9LEPT|nr:prolipoprotein diacylglyceryl transferase [Leptospira mayottensis]AXR60995.1 prolipoprotein diacylglyceryl transferase [Leptospira mayottensis]AXR65747.1 prolipoprotein diacylglyceryl transferase [Leptospira mayottensis]AZQ02571.1 prolipoprotein diacylglyceryl transferase [Leptospira mayottensis 200901116]EKR98822.1 prolipoprotein diacylglyceryl transferase [Leptospira mayottensis 200901122]TGM96843.1 prolipoprotein diacylglyceryl transferase [Leptospira mayottensis]
MIDRIPVPFLKQFLNWDGPSTFSILMMLGFLAASYLLPKELKRRNLEPEHSDWLLLLGILGTLVGAKIFFVFEIWDQIFVETPGFDGKYLYPLTHWYGFPGRMALWDNLFSGSGLVFYGGFLFGILFVTLYMKYFKLDIPSYLDAAVPSMAIGYAIGRLGCWVSGDGCYGFATEMRIPLLVFDYHGAHPSGVPVWNTPLIESIVSFVFFFYFQFWAKNQNFKKFSIGAQYLVLHGFARLMVEFLRVNKAVFPFIDPPTIVNIPNPEQNPTFLNQYYWHGFSQSQWVSIAIILVGTFFLIKYKLWEKETATT